MKMILSLLVLCCISLMPSCATTNVKAYTQAFTSCLEADGISQGSEIGIKIWGILDAGGPSVSAIEESLESSLILVGGQAAEDAATCAVQAWFAQHPVSTKAMANNSQAAARIFMAKHLSSQVRVTNAQASHTDGGIGAVK